MRGSKITVSSLWDKLPQFTLSWKYKLSIVIATTVLGLVMVTSAGFSGLHSVDKRFNQQKLAAGYNTQSLIVAVKLLQLKLDSQNLNADNQMDFSAALDDLIVVVNNMKETAKNLGHQELETYSKEIADLVAEYVNGNKALLETRSTLGFNEEEGQLKDIHKWQKKLEEISFSMIEEYTTDIINGQKGYLITKSPEDKKRLEKGLVGLEALVIDMDWHDIEIGSSTRAYRESYDKVYELVDKEYAISTELQPVLEKLSLIVNQQKEFLDTEVVNQVIAEADNAKAAAMNIMLVAAIIIGLIIFTSLVAVARELNIQLHQMQKFLKSIASGDFSNKLDTNNNEKDEFTQLKLASNTMVHDISEAIEEVVDGNNALLQLRIELEKEVDQLGMSSDEVENKTQQSTEATQQISIAVGDVARRVTQVSETANDASSMTEKGGRVIEDCVNSMSNISTLIEDTHNEVENLSESGKKMLGIIDVINGLADQTNLLALNAAIESARAGEAGRGFSVVADEVRALAQKTVNATSNIGEIIQTFNEQSSRMADLMEKGITLASSGQKNANNARDSFGSIEESIQRVSDDMVQVAATVEEISASTNDIAVQVEHICEQSESTRQIRLSLEGHTHDLTSQSERLGEVTERFKLAK